MRKVICSSLLFFLLFLVVSIGYAQEQDYIEKIQQGSINWTKGVIKVTGIGAPPREVKIEAQIRPMAMRAARTDAYRNFLEIVKGVRVTAETTVNNFVVESDVIRTKVDGLVRGAKQTDIRYMDDGTVEVDLVIPLYGRDGLSGIILPEIVEEKAVEPKIPKEILKRIEKLEQTVEKLIERIEKLETPKGKKTPPVEGKTKETKEKYTGLIIDAQGLRLKPAMSPKILSESGEEIYGSVNVSPEVAIEKGIVGYVRSIDAALKLKERLGNNPLIIKAIDVEGALKANPVIKDSAATLIRNNVPKEVIENCGVVIVL